MRAYIWTFLWATVVLILCVMPTGSQEGVPALFEGAYKLVHVGFSFVLRGLSIHDSIHVRRTERVSWSTVVRVVAISPAFAMFTDVLLWKVFVYRSAEGWDFFAHICGIGMGTFAYLHLHR